MSDISSASPSILNDRSPRLGAPAFICPHCKAFAQQRWFLLGAAPSKEAIEQHDVDQLRQFIEISRVAERRGEPISSSTEPMSALLAALEAGLPFLGQKPHGEFVNWTVSNMHLSSCVACDRAAVWVAGRIRFPVSNAEVAEPNEDLPPDIHRDYVEAAEVVSASPRAAAALLRLAIQKLCSHLLEREGAINEMIGALVTRGLSPLIQRALDVVRVVGNEAVHPGKLDLRDDEASAVQLFGLVNLIAEAMITQPKHVMALYGTLPPDKIAGIEQRDAKAREADDPKG